MTVALSTLIYTGARIWMAWDLARKAIKSGRNLEITHTPGWFRINLVSHSVPKADAESDNNGIEDPPAPQPPRLPWRGKRKGGGQ